MASYSSSDWRWFSQRPSSPHQGSIVRERLEASLADLQPWIRRYLWSRVQGMYSESEIAADIYNRTLGILGPNDTTEEIRQCIRRITKQVIGNKRRAIFRRDSRVVPIADSQDIRDPKSLDFTGDLDRSRAEKKKQDLFGQLTPSERGLIEDMLTYAGSELSNKKEPAPTRWVAQRLGISEDAVRARLCRIKKKLQRLRDNRL